jgi:DNA primase
MDVVALAQMGFANAVATLGTACTAEHVQKLFRFTESVVFSFDGDGAGRRAARKALDAALPFATDVRTVKFLFLPAEHDPDSYIREHGKDGFAEMVAKALPLSKFMLQAAAEGCDLDTAEGRAHMASNARPLWTLLPDGTLKRQLLAEIADKVLIDVRDLLELWQPASKAGSYKKSSYPPKDSLAGSPKSSLKTGLNSGAEAFSGYPDDAGYSGSDEVDYSSSEPHFSAPVAATVKTTRRLAGRLQPASREDRVLRFLLTEPQSWDLLDSDEHHLLCGLPAPHGPLFAWTENQLHDHGPQPWAALREGLRGHAHEAHAIAQISQIPEGIEGDFSEVRSIIDQLVKIRRQQEMQELAGRAATDPLAMQRYKELAHRLQK